MQFWGAFPWHQAWCGDFDICGCKRPQSYYRDILWGVRDTLYIVIHVPRAEKVKIELMHWAWHDVVSCWNWPGFEGKDLTVEVYSGADAVELFLNGRSLGRRPAGKAAGFTAAFTVPYEPGELRAVAHKDGNTKESRLKTAGVPAALRLSADRSKLRAAYGDLSFVAVELVDLDGIRVPGDDREIVFSASGPGVLLAVGSGNPRADETYGGSRRRTYEGCCMAVVKTIGEAGTISFTALTDGLPAAGLTLLAE